MADAARSAGAPAAPAAPGGPGAAGSTPGAPGAPPAAQPPGQPPAGAEVPRETFGGAVVAGVRDAFLPLVRFLGLLGDHILLAARALVWLPRRPARLVNYLDAAEYIGFGSLPI